MWIDTTSFFHSFPKHISINIKLKLPYSYYKLCYRLQKQGCQLVLPQTKQPPSQRWINVPHVSVCSKSSANSPLAKNSILSWRDRVIQEGSMCSKESHNTRLCLGFLEFDHHRQQEHDLPSDWGGSPQTNTGALIYCTLLTTSARDRKYTVIQQKNKYKKEHFIIVLNLL